MNVVEEWEREQDLELKAEHFFSELMRDENEIADVILSGGLAPIWLIKLLEYTEAFESDEKFHEIARPLGTNNAFMALFAAKELRNCIVKVLENRAYVMAERT